MKRIVKQCRQLALAAACFFFILSTIMIPVVAESGICGSGVNWELNNGVLTVNGQGEMDDYYAEHFAPWYSVRNRIVSVVIESGVTGIGDAAFYDCRELKSVRLSDTVASIGDSAFLDCVRLETVEFGNGLQVIGDSSFMLCESLKFVDFNEGLEKIGSQAFMGCKSLVSVVIPNSVISMGDSVFAYCENLVQATVQADVSILPDWTFYGCSDLTDVSLSSSISSLGDSAFYDCTSLNEVYSNTSDSVSNKLTQQIQNDVKDFDSVESSDYVAEEPVIIPNQDNAISVNTNSNDANITTSFKVNEESFDCEIESIVKTEEGLNEVLEELESVKKEDNIGSVSAKIDVKDNLKVDKDLIKYCAENKVNLTLSRNGTEYVIDFSSLPEDKKFSSLSLNYELDLIDKKTGEMIDAVGEAQSYSLKFKDSCDFPIKVKLYVGIEYARNYASLYQKNGKKWDLIHSVQIDRDGYAAFYLSGFDSLTDYMIGLNVEGVNITNAYVPSELSGDYNGLMDEHGNMYEVTGIQSKWGITLSQFSLIVFGVLGGVIVLVGLVMFIIFKMQQNKERVRREVMSEKKVKKTK